MHEGAVSARTEKTLRLKKQKPSFCKIKNLEEITETEKAKRVKKEEKEKDKKGFFELKGRATMKKTL